MFLCSVIYNPSYCEYMIHDDDLWLQRVLEPHNVSVDEDLREGAKQVEVILLPSLSRVKMLFSVALLRL